MNVQELVNRIDALDSEFGKVESEIESLTQQKNAIVKEAKECYAALYDILDPQESSYFAVEDRVVIVNRHYKSTDPSAVTIQPMIKI